MFLLFSENTFNGGKFVLLLVKITLINYDVFGANHRSILKEYGFNVYLTLFLLMLFCILLAFNLKFLRFMYMIETLKPFLLIVLC